MHVKGWRALFKKYASLFFAGRTTTINVTRPTGLRITVGLGVAVDTPRVALDAIVSISSIAIDT